MTRFRLLPLLLLVLASGIAASDVAAQDPSPIVREDQRVRLAPNPVSPGERWLVGTVHRVGADTLWLRVPDFVAPVWVLRSGVRRVQVSRGPGDRASGALGGAMLGAVAGAGAGVLIFSGSDSGNTSSGDWGAVGALMLAVPGALVGGVVGGSRTAEQWEDAGLPGATDAASVAVSPLLRPRAEGGAGVGVSLRF